MSKSILVWAFLVSSCAPTVFQEQGITFIPMDPSALKAISGPHSYDVGALALKNAKTVWYSSDTQKNQIPIYHELKHFRIDPDSPTGYCEHLPDGKTWLHKVCQ